MKHQQKNNSQNSGKDTGYSRSSAGAAKRGYEQDRHSNSYRNPNHQEWERNFGTSGPAEEQYRPMNRAQRYSSAGSEGRYYADDDHASGYHQDIYDARSYDTNFGSPSEPRYDSQFGGRPNHFGRGPKNFKRQDERIEDEINKSLTHHSEIDAYDIEVAVKDGEVTLNGRVTDRRAKYLAEECAEQIYGVKEVNNQIRVRKSDEDQQSSASSTLQNAGTKSSKSSARTAASSRH